MPNCSDSSWNSGGSRQSCGLGLGVSCLRWGMESLEVTTKLCRAPSIEEQQAAGRTAWSVSPDGLINSHGHPSFNLTSVSTDLYVSRRAGVEVCQLTIRSLPNEGT